MCSAKRAARAPTVSVGFVAVTLGYTAFEHTYKLSVP